MNRTLSGKLLLLIYRWSRYYLTWTGDDHLYPNLIPRTLKGKQLLYRYQENRYYLVRTGVPDYLTHSPIEHSLESSKEVTTEEVVLPMWMFRLSLAPIDCHLNGKQLPSGLQGSR